MVNSHRGGSTRMQGLCNQPAGGLPVLRQCGAFFQETFCGENI